MKYEFGKAEDALGAERLQYQKSRKRHSSLKKWSFFISLLLLIGVGYWYFYVSSQQRFPKLPEGSYLGRIYEIFSDEPSGVQFFVESLPSEELLFSLQHPKWKQQRVTMVLGDSQGNWLHPIVIVGSDTKLKFIGKSNGGIYQGSVATQDGSKKGRWELTMISSPDHNALEDLTKLEEWLTLKLQSERLSQEILASKRSVSEQNKEITKLTNFITDVDSLKARAEKKFREVTEKISEEEKVLKQKEKEAQVVENQLVLAQVVTDMGKLVSLSRQTLERENRWIDSVLGSALPPLGEDFQLAVEQAKKIIGVKKAIAEEEEYINHLRSLMQGGAPQGVVPPQATPPPPPTTFGSLWGNAQ